MSSRGTFLRLLLLLFQELMLCLSLLFIFLPLDIQILFRVAFIPCDLYLFLLFNTFHSHNQLVLLIVLNFLCVFTACAISYIEYRHYNLFNFLFHIKAAVYFGSSRRLRDSFRMTFFVSQIYGKYIFFLSTDICHLIALFDIEKEKVISYFQGLEINEKHKQCNNVSISENVLQNTIKE